MSGAGGPRRTTKDAPDLTTLLGLGTLWGAAIGLGLFTGIVVDHRLSTMPLFVVLGLAIGIVVAAVGTYQVIRPYTASRPTPRTSSPPMTTSPEAPDQEG